MHFAFIQAQRKNRQQFMTGRTKYKIGHLIIRQEKAGIGWMSGFFFFYHKKCAILGSTPFILEEFLLQV